MSVRAMGALLSMAKGLSSRSGPDKRMLDGRAQLHCSYRELEGLIRFASLVPEIAPRAWLQPISSYRRTTSRPIERSKEVN